jgi:MFS family permease
LEELRSQSSNRLWTKDFIMLTISNFFMYLNLMMITPTLPAYVSETFGDNEIVVSLVVSLFCLSAILARVFTGKTLDTLGRKRMLLSGLFIFMLSTAGYYWAGVITLFLAVRIIYGIGFGVTGTAYGTIVSDVIPPKRMGEGMGYFGLSSSLSMSIAPMIGIWLLTQYGFGSLIFVSTLLAGLVFPTVFMIRIPERRAIAAHINGRPGNRGWFEKSALLPCTLNMLLSITYGGLISFITLFGKEASIANVGSFFLFYALMVVLVRPISGKLFDRKGHIAVLPFGAIMIALGLVLLSYSTGMYLLVVAALCYGIGYGMLQPALQAWTIQRVSPERRGVVTGIFYNSIDVGIAIGSFLLSIIAAQIGYGAMYRVTSLSMILFLLLYGCALLMVKYRRHTVVTQDHGIVSNQEVVNK